MPYCINCGKKRPDFLLSSNGLCFSCANEARKLANQKAQMQAVRAQRQAERKANPTKVYSVAGTSHYKKNIAEIGVENDDYVNASKEKDMYSRGEKVYKYEFRKSYPIELIPEPDNKHDPNAIKVIIEGQHVGYIEKEHTEKFREYMQSGNDIVAEIYGGDYKQAYENDNFNICFERNTNHFGIRLIVSLQ